MPLYDHFHGALKSRSWEAIHARWGIAIADELNRHLPEQFVAEAPLRLGASVEADVAERERIDVDRPVPVGGISRHDAIGGVAVATPPKAAVDPLLYDPPTTDLQLPGSFPDELVLRIKDRSDGWKVIGAVEIVSPGNKKERAERDQFVAKTMSYLQVGIGVVVIDAVTCYHRNLHNEMIRLAGYDPKFEFPEPTPTYAVSYRPVRRAEQNLIDLWRWPFAVGAALPAVPLPLTGYGCVRLDLEATYAEACERCRIP